MQGIGRPTASHGDSATPRAQKVALPLCCQAHCLSGAFLSGAAAPVSVSGASVSGARHFEPFPQPLWVVSPSHKGSMFLSNLPNWLVCLA